MFNFLKKNEKQIFNPSQVMSFALSSLNGIVNGSKVEYFYNSWAFIAGNYIGRSIKNKKIKFQNVKNAEPQIIPELTSEVLDGIAKAISYYNIAFVRKIKISTKSKNIQKLEVLKNKYLTYDSINNELHYYKPGNTDAIKLKEKDILGGFNGISEVDIFMGIDPTSRKTKIDALMSDLNVDSNLTKLNNKVIINGGKESAIFTKDTVMEDEDRIRFMQQFKKDYSLEQDSYNILVLDDGMKLETNNVDLNKILFDTQLSSIRDKILGAFGVSKVQLGIGESINRSNMQELKDGFFEDTLKPILDLIMETLSNDIDFSSKYKNLFIEYKTASFKNNIREDYKYGTLTKNEYRKLMGYTLTNDETKDDYYTGPSSFKEGSDEEPKADTEKEY